MDPKLVNAAQLGDTGTLAELLNQDPLILNKVALSPIAETPLHIATISGQTQFAKQILTLEPSFARDLNKDGFSPLHIAAATGNTEIVKELLKVVDHKELCLLKDKFGLTPLHHAAIKGRICVIQELVSCCPIAVKQVSILGETALHLAVKNHQFEALKFLVEKFGDDDEIMSTKDKDGNTILELAVATKQLQVSFTPFIYLFTITHFLSLDLCCFPFYCSLYKLLWIKFLLHES